MTDRTGVYTPEAIAEVQVYARTFESLLAGDLEPWRREQLEASLADARDWLQEAADRG